MIKPNLREYHKGDPLVKYFVDGEYTVKPNKYLTKGREFLYKESLVELEDDLIGVNDEPAIINFLEWEKGNEFLKPAKKDIVN